MKNHRRCRKKNLSVSISISINKSERNFIFQYYVICAKHGILGEYSTINFAWFFIRFQENIMKKRGERKVFAA